MRLPSIFRATNQTLVWPSILTAAGFGIGQLLRLMTNLVLARLLVPEVFGLMALITILMIGLEMITDVGLKTSLIQSRRGDNPDYINTAWVIKILRGLLIALILLSVGGLVSDFYNEPKIKEVIPYLAVCSILGGMTSMAPASANRNLWLGRITAMTLVAQLCSIVTMVIWARASPTVSALVAGYVVNTTVITILSHQIFPEWKMRLRWHPEMASQIFNYGKWIFLTSILVFLAGQLDRAALGKLAPLEIVGLYSIGFIWASIPLQIAQVWTNNIIFPMASQELRSDTPRKDILLNYRRWFLLTILVVSTLLYFILTYVFKYLYSVEFMGSIAFFQILIFSSIIKSWDESYRVFNLSLGSPQFTTMGSFLSIVIFLAVFSKFYNVFGAHGIAVAFTISQFGSFFISFIGARKGRLADLKADFVFFIFIATFVSVCFFANFYTA